MSDPATTPNPFSDLEQALKQVNDLRYEAMEGRVGALELLAAQSWVAILKHVPDELRDEFVHDLQVALEDRFARFTPVAQRVASESMENILSSALATVRRGSRGR